MADLDLALDASTLKERDPSRPALLEVTGIAAGGDGVGRLEDGRVVFVARTAPGDRVRVHTEVDRRRWLRARLVAVETPGEARVEPPCPLYDRCGGCQLQHLDYGAQLEAKAMLVAEALRRLGGREVDVPPIRPSPRQLRYRTRVTFTLRRLRGGRVVAGFHELGRPARVLDVDGRCLLPEEALADAWAELRTAWGPGASGLPAGGELRLTLRLAGEQVVLSVDGGARWDEAPALLEAVARLDLIWHRPSSGAWTRVAGEASRGAVAFEQVNSTAAAELRKAVLATAGDVDGERVVDCYAGMGDYARSLGERGASVTAIELQAEAVAVAEALGGQGVTVVEGRVEDRLAACLPADLVILNPPRAGLDERVPALLREHPVPRLVYVSCDPATLARDLGRLGEDYLVDGVEAFDLFPQTAHVETMVSMKHASFAENRPGE